MTTFEATLPGGYDIMTGDDNRVLHHSIPGLVVFGIERGLIGLETLAQAARVAALPFVGPFMALMPDAHYGVGATIGSVIPTRGVVMPSAVGTDIGCGGGAIVQLSDDDLRLIEMAVSAQSARHRHILQYGQPGAARRRIVEKYLGRYLNLSQRISEQLHRLYKARALEPQERQNGLYPKFTITKNSTGEEVCGAFVLRPDRDPASRVALRAYANEVRSDYPRLARELDAWVEKIEQEQTSAPDAAQAYAAARPQAP